MPNACRKRQEVLASLDIRPADYVVEVGAGSIPLPASRLILDKHPFDEAERGGPIPKGVPVLKADAQALPLKRGACDVLVLSHVIEHLPEPARFLEEARRCADRVYLEFPSRPRELMYSWSFHPWLVAREGDRLRFHRNDLPQQFGGFFHEHYDFLLDLWSARRHELLNDWWFGRPRDLRFEFPAMTAAELVRATSAAGAERVNHRGPYAELGIGPLEYSLADRAKLALWALLPPAILRLRRGRRFASDRRPSPPAPLTDGDLARLLCAACRDEAARVERRGDGLACSGCGHRFASDRGVHDFDLAPAADAAARG